MKYVVWGLVLLLAIIHQDFWFWDDGTLVFGFMPITLLYHACISMGAAFTWFLATRFAWPLDEDKVEQLASKHGQPESEGGSPS